MKTLFLKNVAPLAVVTLAITGAFATMSMQKAATTAIPKLGYSLNAQGNCTNVSQACETEEDDYVCRIGGDTTTGAQAFGKDNNGNCVEVLYRP